MTDKQSRTIMVHFVDDVESNLKSIGFTLRNGEHKVENTNFELYTFASDKEYFEKILSVPPPDIALLDIAIGDHLHSGAEMASFVRSHFPKATIIMYSQFDDADTILRYLQAGADEFLSKDTPLEQIPFLLDECHTRITEKHRLASNSHEPVALRHVTVVGATMKSVAEELRRVLQTQLRSLFISGETGTGKEVAAEILHSLLENYIPFVTVNCGAIPASLMESQLFGHAKGAYTGANTAREGYFESASNGWIFLDEVGDLSMPAQVALLRVLENQEIIRLGENTPRRINVKVISATNQDLYAKVVGGTFRRDLLERLSAHHIILPPLRERKNEIKALCEHFLSQVSHRQYHLAPTTLDIISRYSWPTNVRELRNVILDMTVFAFGDMLLPSSIPTKIIQGLSKKDITKAKTLAEPIKNELTIKMNKEFPQLLELEAEVLLAYAQYLLAKNKITTLRELAELMHISHSTLLERLKNLKESEIKIPHSLKALQEKDHG